MKRRRIVAIEVEFMTYKKFVDGDPAVEAEQSQEWR